MQFTKKNVEKEEATRLQKFIKKAKKTKDERLTQAANEVYKYRPFAERNKGIYNGSKVLSFLASMVSIATGISCLSILFSNLNIPIWISSSIGLMLVASVEYIKRISLGNFMVNLFRDRQANLMYLTIALTTVSISGLVSYQGAKEITYLIDNKYKPSLHATITSNLKDKANERILKLREDIKEHKRNKWKGVVVNSSLQSIKELNKQITIIEDNLRNELKEGNKQQQEQLAIANNGHNIRIEKIGLILVGSTILCEVILLLSFIFQRYYLFNKWVNSVDTIKTSTGNNGSSNNKEYSFPDTKKQTRPEQRTLLTDTVIKHRVCALDGCNNSLDGMRSNAKYCCPEHKKMAWQKKKLSSQYKQVYQA